MALKIAQSPINCPIWLHWKSLIGWALYIFHLSGSKAEWKIGPIKLTSIFMERTSEHVRTDGPTTSGYRLMNKNNNINNNNNSNNNSNNNNNNSNNNSNNLLSKARTLSSSSLILVISIRRRGEIARSLHQWIGRWKGRSNNTWKSETCLEMNWVEWALSEGLKSLVHYCIVIIKKGFSVLRGRLFHLYF